MDCEHCPIHVNTLLGMGMESYVFTREAFTVSMRLLHKAPRAVQTQAVKERKGKERKQNMP